MSGTMNHQVKDSIFESYKSLKSVNNNGRITILTKKNKIHNAYGPKFEYKENSFDKKLASSLKVMKTKQHSKFQKCQRNDISVQANFTPSISP
eukprot:CAMPEP_0196996456 /NCGR_PEP_ID=MMETSP1380-20130617/2327_1 /TAXON_ID=5936 /ORGANISM="Euplotes crassus, Strain CT5" /LENGTH=92 /DNA_ID=CAMNT_0042412423 /DNA_START=103 /DNA_END=378 /DNA_ORIENTATION=-